MGVFYKYSREKWPHYTAPHCISNYVCRHADYSSLSCHGLGNEKPSQRVWNNTHVESDSSKMNQPLCALLKWQTFFEIITQLFTWFKHIYFITVSNGYDSVLLCLWCLARLHDTAGIMKCCQKCTLWEASRNSACYKIYRINRKL